MAGHFGHLPTNVKEDQLITEIHSQISQLPSSYKKQTMEAIVSVLPAVDNRSSAENAHAASSGTTYNVQKQRTKTAYICPHGPTRMPIAIDQ
jgi:hypothetical protein